MTAAVVTGAAGGIGRALATHLADAGHHVHLADLAPTTDLAAELGGTAHVVDVSRPDDLLTLAAQATDADVVCLNAGVVGTHMGAPWEAPLDEWHRLLDVNLLGVVHGLRAFVPQLVGLPGPSRLVITASLAGLLTFPGGGAYAATKHALVAVAEQTAFALRDSRVTVTLLCPALVRSGMSPDGADPADVAAEALDAARQGRFLVHPDEWTSAIRSRTAQLVSGDPIDPPAFGS